MRRTGTAKHDAVSCKTEQYNMVTRSNSIIPTYDLSKRETFITLYFNMEDDLIIVGNMVDSDYIFWMSFSKTTDKKKNEEIFNHIVNDEPERVSCLYRVLEHNEIPYEMLDDFYRVHLRRICAEEKLWKTPFGHDYTEGDKKQSGSIFANDVSGFLKEVFKLCEIRECGGAYEEILTSYESFLQKQECYTFEVEKMEELLKMEEYLCVSPRKKVRDSYKRCRKQCLDLHNR